MQLKTNLVRRECYFSSGSARWPRPARSSANTRASDQGKRCDGHRNGRFEAGQAGSVHCRASLKFLCAHASSYALREPRAERDT